MPSTILTQTVASITEFKANPMATMKSARGEAIAVLNRNEPAFYCVPPQIYEQLMEMAQHAETQYKQETDQIIENRLYQGKASVGASFTENATRQEIEETLFGVRL